MSHYAPLCLVHLRVRRHHSQDELSFMVVPSCESPRRELGQKRRRHPLYSARLQEGDFRRRWLGQGPPVEVLILRECCVLARRRGSWSLVLNRLDYGVSHPGEGVLKVRWRPLASARAGWSVGSARRFQEYRVRLILALSPSYSLSGRCYWRRWDIRVDPRSFLVIR